ncbi:MAG: HAD family hydrolase [Chloroflexi bacterium]|nr:HAD family hydrolase [Chloroflexota bacterium]
MTDEASTVLLVDLDNTLIDASGASAAINAGIRASLGEAAAERFWGCYEEVRADLGYVDIHEAMLRLGREQGDVAVVPPLVEAVYGVDYRSLLYPGALEALTHARGVGLPVVVSDGHPGYQRHKALAAGVSAAVEGHVLVYADKTRELDDITTRFPADHYVVIDDKPSVHAAMKAALGPRVTTVLVEQGRYAREGEAVTPPPDLRLPSIAAFAGLSAAVLRGG